MTDYLETHGMQAQQSMNFETSSPSTPSKGIHSSDYAIQCSRVSIRGALAVVDSLRVDCKLLHKFHDLPRYSTWKSMQKQAGCCSRQVEGTIFP